MAVDEFGNLFLIATGPKYVFQFLGEVNYASNISYLDNNFIFIGSDTANSQLVSIRKTPDKNSTDRPFIDITEEYENIGPLIDFSVTNNLYEETRTEIMCLSGSGKSSCFKSISKGTSISNLGEFEISAENIFSVYFRNSDCMNDSGKVSLVVVSGDLINTLCYTYEPEHLKFESFNNESFFCSEKTYLVSNFNINENQDLILQVTSSFINIYDQSLVLQSQVKIFIPPTQCVFKTNSNFLYIYNTNNLLLRYTLSDLTKEPEVLSDAFNLSCFDVSESLVAFSDWRSADINLLSTKTKKIEKLISVNEGNSAFISSLLFVKEEGAKYLFASLSSGKLLKFKMKSKTLFNYLGSIASRMNLYTFTADDFVLKRQYNISNDCYELQKVKIHGKNNIFLNTSVPSLIYIKNDQSFLSNLNIRNCSNFINLDSKNIYSTIHAFLFQDKLCIGMLSGTQSQNIASKNVSRELLELQPFTFEDESQKMFAFISEGKNKI